MSLFSVAERLPEKGQDEIRVPEGKIVIAHAEQLCQSWAPEWPGEMALQNTDAWSHPSDTHLEDLGEVLEEFQNLSKLCGSP